MFKKFAVLMLTATLSTGCRKTEGPHTQETLTVYNANPLLGLDSQLTDNTIVRTNEVNGVDGFSEKVTLCKKDASGKFFGCQTATSTGVLTDGTMIEFNPGNITVLLAVTNGYYQLIVEVDGPRRG
jgi:hypothetical protein